MINPAEGGDFHLAKTGDFGVAVDTADEAAAPDLYAEFTERCAQEARDAAKALIES